MDSLDKIFTKELQNEFVAHTPSKKTVSTAAQEPTPKLEINYTNYSNSKIILKKYKIPELKSAAKSFHIKITGSKTVLIGRIEEHFNLIRVVSNIQRCFRGWLARLSIRLRGSAVNNRRICVNDTDFITMEPLREIPNEYFYSYTDEQKFTYGFNIVSLIQLISKKTKIENPYNREKFSDKMVSEIIALYRSTYIIYPEFKKENPYFSIQSATGTTHTHRRYNANTMRNIRNRRNRAIENRRETQEELNDDEEDIPEPEPRTTVVLNYRPVIATHNELNTDDIQRFHDIQQIRERTVEQRINNLFVEIDHLGNYTQSGWFAQLDLRNYNRLYRCLYDIWSFRSQMDNETRYNICPFHSPFDGIFARPVQYGELNLEQMRLVCLIVMENFIYSGIDEDYRKIGCFHALSGLTVVSHSARMAMPWLYESVMYH